MTKTLTCENCGCDIANEISDTWRNRFLNKYGFGFKKFCPICDKVTKHYFKED